MSKAIQRKYLKKSTDYVELENFTGKTVESVLQDLYSTLYVTNLETILTLEASEELKVKKTSKNGQKVNHNVSFHAIKMSALNLLFSEIPTDEILRKLRALFLTNPEKAINAKKSEDSASIATLPPDST